MKKILRDQSGMALPTVLGIMLVVAILATGMFYFSYNELNFSTMNKEQGQAQYLAKAGVEIAAKAFPGVSGKFTMTEGGTPVNATLYLHYDESGEASLNSVEADNEGKVDITVTQKKREVETGVDSEAVEVDTWCYEAVAQVGNSKGTAKGYTLPTALATSDPDPDSETADSVFHLNWVDSDGVIGITAKDAAGNDIYQQGESTEAGGLTGIINDLFDEDFGSFETYYAVYNGVVTVDEDSLQGVNKLSMEKTGKKRIFIWAAPAVVVEGPVDFRNSWSVKALAIAANTVIFEDEVHLYANSIESRMGDLILQPLNNATAQVYFNDNVYLHIGSNRYKLFDAGTVYNYTEAVELFTWAVNAGKADAGLSNWIRKIFKEQHTGTLTKEENPPVTLPNTNSLSKIIWE